MVYRVDTALTEKLPGYQTTPVTHTHLDFGCTYWENIHSRLEILNITCLSMGAFQIAGGKSIIELHSDLVTTLSVEQSQLHWVW